MRVQVPDSWSTVSVDEGDVCVAERPAHPATSDTMTTRLARQEQFMIRLSLLIGSLRAGSIANSLEQAGHHRRGPVRRCVGESNPAQSVLTPQASNREQQI